MNQAQVENFLCEALETEIWGVHIYGHAIECAQNPALRAEWQMYRDQTRRHEQVLRDVCSRMRINPVKESPGRQAVRALGEALVRTMEIARESGELRKAQVIAAEAVLHAETKDHMNWQLIGLIAKEAPEPMAAVLREAYDEIEDQEDEHFFHTRGWVRELAADTLGIKTVLPPPEEKMDVKSAMGAATAEAARAVM